MEYTLSPKPYRAGVRGCALGFRGAGLKFEDLEFRGKGLP